MGDVETATTTSKTSVSTAMAKAVGDWPVVVLGIAGFCTVAWAWFLVWLITRLVRLAFA